MNVIYKITNKVNGRIYVGQTRNIKNRMRDHFKRLKANKHHNSYLQRDYNKCGKDSFNTEILDIAAFEFSVDNLERFWIKFYDATNRCKGYNRDSGGCKNKRQSDETKLKNRLAHLGKKNPRVSALFKGVRRSPATEFKAGPRPDTRGPGNPMYGKIGPKPKKVKFIPENKTFESIRHVATYLKVSRGYISMLLNGYRLGGITKASRFNAKDFCYIEDAT